MKMDQLYRRFRGTVRFTAEGGHALRMPGLLAADGIPLYGVTPTDLGFEAEIAAEHYRKAAKAAAAPEPGFGCGKSMASLSGCSKTGSVGDCLPESWRRCW